MGMAFDEARLINSRDNRYHATQAELLRMAIVGSFDKEAGREFTKRLARLIEE